MLFILLSKLMKLVLFKSPTQKISLGFWSFILTFQVSFRLICSTTHYPHRTLRLMNAGLFYFCDAVLDYRKPKPIWFFGGRPLAVCSRFVHCAIAIPSVRLSDTLVICDHTFKPIETILVSLEAANSSFWKSKLCSYGSPLTPPSLGFQSIVGTTNRRRWSCVTVLL